MKRPDHRCHGVPVLRDVAPDRVPVAIHEEDGTLWGVFDLDAGLVAEVERVARREQCTFAWAFTQLALSNIRPDETGEDE